MTGSAGNTSRAHVEAFFQTYQRAFQERDPELIHSCFHPPVFVATDTGTEVRTAWFDSSHWQAVTARLLAQYDKLQVGHVERRNLAVIEMSARLLMASVRWSLFSQREELLYEFDAVYTLESGADGLLILAIAHDEAARATAQP